MRIFEILSDKLFNLPLFEMAYERKNAINLIRNLQPTLSEHLIKYFAFDHSAKEHWLDEINGYLVKIDHMLLKPNGKKLSGDTYYSLMWEEPFDSSAKIERRIRQMVAGEYASCQRSEFSASDIYERIERLLHAISYDIARDKFVNIRDYLT